MFRKHEKDLFNLINSFRHSISNEILDGIIENVEFNEFGLAIESLSDWIYELNIIVTSSQQTEILRLSDIFGVDEKYHLFIGRTPPYPDLRTEEHKEIKRILSNPTLESVKTLANKGFKVYAVKMYRELYGGELKEAIEKVEELIK